MTLLQGTCNGQYYVVSITDPNNLFLEYNETNNWASITFTVTGPPQADLTVSSLGLGAASVAQGQNLGFVYTIVNNVAATMRIYATGGTINGTTGTTAYTITNTGNKTVVLFCTSAGTWIAGGNT